MRTRPIAILRAALGPLALVALAAAQLWPGLSAGLSPPITWDHGAHLGKAMQTVEELWPLIRGWTDRVELGVPLNAVYTPNGTLWLLLWRAVTPWLEWPQTYALAILAFRSLVGLAVYRLARVAGASRAGAFLGGVIALADPGDHSEGGWFYDVLYGVWPMSLAMCAFFAGLADLWRWLDTQKRAPLVRATLLLGVALFSHQMVLLGALTVVPMLVLSRWLDGGDRAGPELARAIGVVAVGALVASWWLLPMLAGTEWLGDHGQLYVLARELGERAASGSPLPRMGVFEGVLFTLAILFGLFSRGPRRFLALGAAAMMLVATSSWLYSTDAIGVVPALGRIMSPRFAMLAKPLGFALVGLGLGELCTAAWRRVAPRLLTLRGLVGVGLAILVIAPTLGGVLPKVRELVVTREVTYTATRPGWSDYLEYARWMRSEPDDPFFRVAYYDPSSHIFQSAAAYTGKPAHKLGQLIAEAFRNVTDSAAPDALRDMNVRYVVSWGPPPPELRASIRRVRDFGPIEVAELTGWTSALAIERDGGRELRVVARARNRLVVAPAGARSIVIRRAAGPGWRATVDGEAIDVHAEPLATSPDLSVMRVEVPAGARRVELRYLSWLPSEILGWALTLLGLAIVLLFALGDRLPASARDRLASLRAALTRLDPRPRIPERARPVVVAVLVLLVLAPVAFRVLGAYRFTAHSEDAVVDWVHADGRVEPCMTPRDEGGHACAQATWVAIGPETSQIEGRLRSCTWAHPPHEGLLRATFPEAHLGREIVLGAGILDQSEGVGLGDPVRIRVLDGQRVLGSLDVPFGRKWVETRMQTEPGHRDIVFEVQAVRTDARRWLCFDAVAR